jgi:hypothetical protein
MRLFVCMSVVPMCMCVLCVRVCECVKCTARLVSIRSFFSGVHGLAHARTCIHTKLRAHTHIYKHTHARMHTHKQGFSAAGAAAATGAGASCVRAVPREPDWESWSGNCQGSLGVLLQLKAAMAPCKKGELERRMLTQFGVLL